MENQILVPIAQGTEEMEAVTVVDILRRAGLKVIIAGENEIISCANKVKILPDKLIENLPLDNLYSAIVIPGGITGAKILRENEYIKQIVKFNRNNGNLIAAICAGPTVLSAYGILDNIHSVTSHPSVRNEMQRFNYLEDDVVVSDGIVTSRGAGTAIPFALKLVELLVDFPTAEKIASDIQYKRD